MSLTAQDFARGRALLDNTAKVRKVTPGEAQANQLVKEGIGRKFYRPLGSQDERAWRREKPKDGQPYEYAVRVKPNDKGKLTRGGQALMAAMMPSIRLGTELAPQRKAPLVAMSSPEGVQYVEPHHAERAAKSGWHHRIAVARGASVSVGLEGGMLFRRARDSWEPTGRKTCGPFGKPADKRLLHVDPSGNPWRWISGEGWTCFA